jgi:D-aspartate ligase
VTNPLWYRAETDPRRLAYLAVAQANQVRKYRRYYPTGDA